MQFKDTKEDIEYLKQNVSIQTYAEDMVGITEWKQVGRSYVTPKIEFAAPDSNDMSSLVIDLQANCFWRNSGKGRNPHGSIIDFIMNTEDVDFSQAVKILIDYGNRFLAGIPDRNEFAAAAKSKRQSSLRNVSREFKLPLRHPCDDPHTGYKRLFAYLVGFRKITPHVYDYFIDNNYMYQDLTGKCIYVSYNEDGVPVFGCVRDTNWNERITYGVTGSDVDHAFYINNHSNKMVVTEAVIDAMAYMSLFDLNGDDFAKFNYLALTGCSKYKCIKYWLEKDPSIETIYLALDNDKAGENARTHTKKMLSDMHWDGKIVDVRAEHGKDINDELKYVVAQKGETNDHKQLKAG